MASSKFPPQPNPCFLAISPEFDGKSPHFLDGSPVNAGLAVQLMSVAPYGCAYCGPLYPYYLLVDRLDGYTHLSNLIASRSRSVINPLNLFARAKNLTF